MSLYRDKKLYIRFLAVLLSFCLIAVGSFMNFNIVKAQNIDELPTELVGFETEIVSGDKTLYINPSNGNFAIKNTSTGHIWHSTPENLDDADMKNSKKNHARSALLLTVLDNYAKKGTVTVTSQSGSVRDTEPEITVKGDTAKIVYVFEEYGFTVPLSITLTKYGFSALVDTKEIKENNAQYSLVAISVLPYFNAGYYEDTGFMLVPDGSGAVIEFNNGRGDFSEYSQRVYGRDYALSLLYNTDNNAKVCMPFFGIAKNDSYSMGFIKGGASLATVKGIGNTYNNLYNYCYADFTLRGMDYYRNEGKWQDVEVYQKSKLPQLEIKLEYILAESVAPDYGVMATKLREYLVDEYDLKVTNSSSLQLDIFGATVKKRMLLGVPVYGIQKLTDFGEAKEIVESLYDTGIGPINLVYKKWSKATVRQKMSPSDSLSLLGGKRKFAKLKELIKSKDGNLYLEVNPFYVKSGKGLLSQFTDFAHDIFNSTVEMYPYKLNTYAQNKDSKAGFFVKNSAVGEQVKSWDKQLADLDIDGILYSGTGMLHSDFREEGTSSYDFENRVGSALAKTESAVITDGGDFYAAVSSEYLSGLTMSSSEFDIEDYSIPFVQMVLHGIKGYSGEPINAQANYKDAFLKSVESGSALRFVFATTEIEELENSEDSELIYSSFSKWKNDVVKMYTEYNKFYESINEAVIVAHLKLQDHVYITEYSNGYYSIVNYSDSAVSGTYGKIEAKAFITGEK